MRVVFLGAATLTVATARMLSEQGHEVVIIEQDQGTIDALAEELDCAFLVGDGTRPAVLRQADPNGTDFLFCLTGNDQTNIIGGLVGQSLGFPRVITKLEDEELEHICLELGLSETIVPDLAIAARLADIVEGQGIEELALMIKGDARVLSFVAGEAEVGRIADLGLPGGARVICVYRDGGLLLPEAETALRAGDEVVLITHRRHLPSLSGRWQGPRAS
jgi:trk system potassium uptake protein TrkA